MKVCHKTCIFCFFRIINKYLCMAKCSLLSRCHSYVAIGFPIIASRRKWMRFHKSHFTVETLENEKYSGNNINISYTTESFRTDITITLILNKDRKFNWLHFRLELLTSFVGVKNIAFDSRKNCRKISSFCYLHLRILGHSSLFRLVILRPDGFFF